MSVFAADYPFMDILWTMIIFFVWVAWIWMLVIILTDVFGRRDIGGWAKAAWTIFLVVIPFLGILVYLIANHDGIGERRAQQTQAAQAEFDTYVRSVAANGGGGAAAEIEKGKQLLDSGAITQQEFEALKAKAMA
jgi:Phospholipase_D-nuclease N-terminal/Short C-terminal domain